MADDTGQSDKVVPLRRGAQAPLPASDLPWDSPVNMLKNIIKDIEQGVIVPDGIVVMVRDAKGGDNTEAYPSYWMDLNETEVLGLLMMGALIHVRE